MVLMECGKRPYRLKQLLWFAGLYAAGVGALAIVAYGLRALLKTLV
jgi:hypothetical protein